MKKIFPVLAALVLMLSGCGEASPEVDPSAADLDILLSTAVTETQPAPQNREINVTLYNWQEFFTVETLAEQEGESWTFGVGILLKPQYLESCRESRVDFELGFQGVRRKFIPDGETGEYTLGEQLGESLESDYQVKTLGLEDFRESSEASLLSGKLGAFAVSGSTEKLEDGSLWVLVPEAIQVLHAEGTLILSE